MNLKYIVLTGLLTQGLLGYSYKDQELFKCNLSHRNVAAECDIDGQMKLYQAALADESNYKGMACLEDWDNGYLYPAMHPAHQVISDIVTSLAINSICEVGAGCGRVSKYVYAKNPALDLTCIEHNSFHFSHIKENFEERTWVVQPDIIVKANLIKACLPNLSQVASNNFDLVFTCTVMMHLPFIPAIFSALELVRISKRYILHVENKNQGDEWYNMTIVKPPTMSPINYLGIDYVKLYESLGVKTIQYREFKDPLSPATFIVYLGEKVQG